MKGKLEFSDVIKSVTTLLVLGLGIYVALSPSAVYAPTPKIILYFLVSFLPALLFGAEAASRFDLNLPGFAFTTAGACAVCLGALLLLTHLSKPEAQIAVYRVYDESGNKATLDFSDAVEISSSFQGIPVGKFVDGNTIGIIFPEQVGEVKMRIKDSPFGATYVGVVGYAGSRESELVLSKGRITSLSNPK